MSKPTSAALEDPLGSEHSQRRGYTHSLPLQQVQELFRQYGCELNAIEPRQLFARYEAAGFLYPEKRQRLEPYWDRIEENWSRIYDAGRELAWVATSDSVSGGWASVSVWRSTHRTWTSQHLVGFDAATSVASVMLVIQRLKIMEGSDVSLQNWHRPNNRYANKVFGSLERALEPQRASVCPYTCFAFGAGQPIVAEHVQVVEVSNNSDAERDLLLRLARATRGNVYAAAEELDHPDLELRALDEVYRRVGLSRTRRIWLALVDGEPAGAAIAYRGPLGLNFSFLENRCDLLLASGLEEGVAESVSAGLVNAAQRVYEDLETGSVLLTADPASAEILRNLGGEVVRTYAQAIWMRDAYEGFYKHIEKFYSRILRRTRGRRQLESGTHAQAVEETR